MNEKRLNTEWMRYGACKDMGSELFMSETQKDIKAAKAICLGCPAVKACLEFAIDNKEQGVWGGTTERQRRRIVKYKNYQISAKPIKVVDIDSEV